MDPSTSPTGSGGPGGTGRSLIQLVYPAMRCQIRAAFVYEPVDGKTHLARTAGARTGRNVVVCVVGIALAVALALSVKPAASQMHAPGGPRVAATADPAGLDRFLALDSAPDPLPSYHISIEAKPLRRLLDYRARIYDLEFLPPGERLWVRAVLESDGERYAIRMRIRGDLPAHWRGEQHSYRVKFTHRLLEAANARDRGLRRERRGGGREPDPGLDRGAAPLPRRLPGRGPRAGANDPEPAGFHRA